MQELRLVAVSEDGSYLVLATAGRGTRFTLPVDDRLRAAVRGHFSRLGQFEIEVESPLRPKEIQARIRAGETAEEIAESAGIPVERVRWFEGPVLQEREYMAQQAQRVTVRRQGESSPAPPLGEMVEERLGRRGVDLEEVEWDSWKCEDNTWRVRLSFFDEGRPNAAEWIFDPRRRQVSPLDEEAAALSSQVLDESVTAPVTQLVPRRPAMKIVSDTRTGPVGPLGPRREDAAASRITDPARRPAVPTRWDTPGSAGEGVSYASFDEGYDLPADDAPPGAPGASGASGASGEDMGAVAAATGVYLSDPSPEQTVAPPRMPYGPAQESHPAPQAEPASEAQHPIPRTPTAPAEPNAQQPVAPPASDARQPVAAPAAEARQQTTSDAPASDASGTSDPRTSAQTSDAQDEQIAAEPAAAQDAGSSAPQQQPVAEPAPARQKPAASKPAAGAQPAAPAGEPVRPVAGKPPVEPPARPATAPTPEPAQVAAAAVPPEPPAAPPARGGRRKSARGKRASVPSWDEIMFGARRPD